MGCKTLLSTGDCHVRTLRHLPSHKIWIENKTNMQENHILHVHVHVYKSLGLQDE